MPLVHNLLVQIDPENQISEPGAKPVFVRALEDWLRYLWHAGHLSQDSSEQAYRDIWAVFMKWCLSQKPVVDLRSMTAADLQTFIADKARTPGSGPDKESWTPRYIWRFLHLVERVTAHLASSTQASPNLAAREVFLEHPEWLHANASQQDPLPEYLDAGQAKLVVDFLSAARPRPGREALGLKWPELRNRCGIALQLGAGLTPGEVRSLLTTGVVIGGGAEKGVPWKIKVPASAVTPARESPIAPWAAQLLQHWLATRATLAIAGPYLFPSTRTGRAWGKVSQYQSVARVLAAAGLPAQVVQGGSYRLRHTFALRQLRRGVEAAEVAKWLGVVDPSVMSRYRRVLPAPVPLIV